MEEYKRLQRERWLELQKEKSIQHISNARNPDNSSQPQPQKKNNSVIVLDDEEEDEHHSPYSVPTPTTTTTPSETTTTTTTTTDEELARMLQEEEMRGFNPTTRNIVEVENFDMEVLNNNGDDPNSAEIIDPHPGKVFYFCKKKTNSN